MAKIEKSELVKKYGGMAAYIGEWGNGISKAKLIGNIHRNLLGLDKMGRLRPPEDLAYFLLICKQYGLNPLKKEIYPVYQRSKNGNEWVEKLEPIVSIHGLRSLARTAGNPTYAYTGKASFEEQDGRLLSATVEVFGRFTGATEAVKVGEYTAYMEEFCRKYNGEPQGNWARMPRVMLIKCAEANALRAAFGLGGVYAEEEMLDGQLVLSREDKEEAE